MSTCSQTGVVVGNHRRAVRFFWGLLIGATVVSLAGNIVRAVLPFVPTVAIQIGAAAVPPIVLLAAVHGIGLAVRAGASGRAYWSAIVATALIGLGAFAVSFLALRGLMLAIGYSPSTAWIFPAIVDTTIGVSTLMLVALGDKPARRSRSSTPQSNATGWAVQPRYQRLKESALLQVKHSAPPNAGQPVLLRSMAQESAPAPSGPTQMMQSVHSNVAPLDANLAIDLIASGVTTQSEETVAKVLSMCRGGASINAAAKALGINYRTVQRIVKAATSCEEPGSVAAS